MGKRIKKLLRMRLGRKHYFIGIIVTGIPLAVMNGLLPFLINSTSIAQLIMPFISLPIILYLAIRRFHDLGVSSVPFLIYVAVREIMTVAALFLTPILDFSGWLSFFMLINICVGAYLLFAKGTDDSNSYGSPTSELPWKQVLFGASVPVVNNPKVAVLLKKFKGLSLFLILTSVVVFILLMIFWSSAPDPISYILITMFFVGLVLQIIKRPLSEMLAKHTGSESTIATPHRKSSKFHIVIAALLLVVLGLLVFLLVNGRRSPSIYECLELGSAAARRQCMYIYHRNE